MLPESNAFPRLCRSLRNGLLLLSLAELLSPFEEACFSKAARVVFALSVSPEDMADARVFISEEMLDLSLVDELLLPPSGGGGGGCICCAIWENIADEFICEKISSALEPEMLWKVLALELLELEVPEDFSLFT